MTKAESLRSGLLKHHGRRARTLISSRSPSFDSIPSVHDIQQPSFGTHSDFLRRGWFIVDILPSGQQQLITIQSSGIMLTSSAFLFAPSCTSAPAAFAPAFSPVPFGFRLTLPTTFRLPTIVTPQLIVNSTFSLRFAVGEASAASLSF